MCVCVFVIFEYDFFFKCVCAHVYVCVFSCECVYVCVLECAYMIPLLLVCLLDAQAKLQSNKE